MLLCYCVKCRKNTSSKNPKDARTKNGRIMLLSKCAVFDSTKSTFIKQQEASGLLSSLEINTPLRKNSFCSSSFVLIVLKKLIQGKCKINLCLKRI